MKCLYLFPLACLLLACGGSGSSQSSFVLVSTNLVPGQSIAINQTIEFTFSQPVDFSTVNFSSILVTGLAPDAAQAPIAGPVQGIFYPKPGSKEQCIVFQPSCPSQPNLSDAGLTPGNSFGAVKYQIALLASIRSSTGQPLRNPTSMVFQTTQLPANPFLDPKPGSAPQVLTQGLASTLGLNLFLRPNDPILITLDQPVLSSSIDEQAIRLECFDPGSGETWNVPVSITLTANCTQQQQSQLTVIPHGVLPEGKTLRFYLASSVRGLGQGDFHFQEIWFHTSTVQAAGSPQLDALVDEFHSPESLDEFAPLLVPSAIVQNGILQAAPLFPSTPNGIEIEIGPLTTNGPNVYFSTDSSTLKDTQGQSHTFSNGVIEVDRFTIKSPLAGQSSSFQVLGSQPLRIRTTNSFVIEEGAILSLDGQTAPDVAGLHLAHLPTPGGMGVASGGDGGLGSPLTTQSDPKGGDGAGAFQVPNHGGKGGHSGFGSANLGQTRPGGGGGGNWGIQELDSSGQWTAFCYSSSTCNIPGCPAPLSGCANPGCNGLSTNPSSQGESGASGVASALDALTAQAPSAGGNPGPAVFLDGLANNNFAGKKPNADSLIWGELVGLQGGQGGGAGGDNVPSLIFPSGSNFSYTDMRGAGGGGGAGAVQIQSWGPIVVRGSITANGGDGARGEEIEFNAAGAGGGGGGSGGMVQLESATQVLIGFNAQVQALGGNRGLGGGNLPGSSGGGGMCRGNTTASRGGAAGKGLVQLHLPFSSPASSDCDGDGFSEPRIQSNALLIEIDAQGNTVSVDCERDSQLRARFDPDPHVLVPSVGARSAAVGNWTYLGNLFPAFSFSPSPTVLASGSGATAVEGVTVTLESAELAESIGSESKTLRLDLFEPVPGAEAIPIQDASVSENKIRITLETAVTEVGSWKIWRRNFQTTIDSAPSAWPSDYAAQIQFQAAEELIPGSMIPNPSSVVGPTQDMNALQGKNLLRFYVDFENLSGVESTQVPGIQFIKLPYSF